MAFTSNASNLVPGDTNNFCSPVGPENCRDVFVHDRQTGETTRVSVASDGSQANYWSSHHSISSDGRFVAFLSAASNLVPDDTNGWSDIFVHDRQTGQTERVSVASDGSQANSFSFNPNISSDGRFVAFHSPASNLVPGDTNNFCGSSGSENCRDVFVHDRQTGETERVSVASDGSQANTAAWIGPISAISHDGRFVAFYSYASNLVTGDTNGYPDVFVHDRQTGTTERVSVDSGGGQGNYLSEGSASISGDGRFVAFTSYASNLVAGDTNGWSDVFVHDRQTGETERVSVASDGSQANWGSEGRDISDDGRFVAFHSFASNLVPGDTNGVREIFVHDRQTGETERVTVASDGSQGNLDSDGGSISGDGRFVAFASGATNLVPEDTNDFCPGLDGPENCWDVFVHDRGSAAPVGGIAEYPDVAAPAGESSARAETYTLAVGLAAALLAVTAGAWYARRRWLR